MEERKYYELHVAGLTRQLPICEVNPHLDIAGFVIFGDVEMTVNATAELLKKCPEFDYIVTAEAKGIPLAYEFARQSGKPYYIARKALKLYMTDPSTSRSRASRPCTSSTCIWMGQRLPS